MRLAGRTAIVTGAAGNLGQAVCHRLAGEGASLVLLERDQTGLAKLQEALPGAHVVRTVDLLNAADVAEAVSDVGPVDIVCATAGGFDMGSDVHATPAEMWQRLQAINVGTLLPLLSAVVPGMIKRGSGKIITVGAHAALRGVAKMGAYCAAKSAVMRITESASAELIGHGINVNAVLPTIIDTPQNRAAMPKADPANWVSPDQLAGVIAFLASPDADAIHGALIPVTGRS
ncbi:MAG: SDR family NAD(P)-dependent oxidoreductase [Aestuariivirgaceae bacterium]